MPFTAIDDAPAGFTALDDAPSGFTPLDDEQPQGPAPEGAVMSAVRTGLSSIVPAIGTALGATGAGLLATPETVGLGTIPAAVAGGAAGGFAGKELQNWALGPEFVAQNEAQMAANRKAHEIASGAGEIVPTLVSMAGGGGAVPKLLGIGERAVAAAGLKAGTKEAEAVAAKAIADATSGFTPSAIALRSAESALGGARLRASQTAQQPDATVGDFANNIAKSAVEFGPLGILPHAETLAKALGYSVPQSAITTLAGNAYDALVNGQPMDFQKIKDQGLANVIPFALFNAVAHGVGMAGNLAPKAPLVEHELDAPIAQAAAAGQPKTAEALVDYKKGIEKQTGEAADIFPPNENTENRPVETDDQGNTGPSLLGTEGGETTTPTTEAAPEIPDTFNPQPVEENALPIESPSGVLQHPQEGTGEAGGERERVEPSEQGQEAAAEGQPPSQGADTQNGGDVGQTFSVKNAVTEEYLKSKGLPEVPKGTGADVVKRIADSRQAYLDNPQRAYDLVKKVQEDPAQRLSIEDLGILDNHFVDLNRRLDLTEIEARNENLTEDQRQDAANRADKLGEDIYELADVSHKLGTAWSDEGRGRQVELDKDFGVVRQLVRRIRLKGGELSKEERQQTEQESREYEKISKDLEAMNRANAEAAKAEAGNNILEGIKKKPTAKKISRTDVEEKIKQSLVKTTEPEPTEETPKIGEIQSSVSAHEGEPSQVTTEHQKEAISDLQKSQIGKTLLRGTVIVPDWQRVISNDELNRGFSTAEINLIKGINGRSGAEGFYDPQSGKAVVIRENVVPREHETPAEAIKRVILHERVGHEGMRWMLDNDPKFRKAWHEAAAKIPQVELDEIAKTYGHLGVNSDQLIGEWFARQAERLDPNEIPDPKTVFGKMWQAVKDFLARYFGNETNLDQKVRDLVGQIVRNPDAFEGRKGLEGDLETQHSLPKEEDHKNPLDKLPHSVLDLLARYHVQEGAKTEPELTKAMHETLKTHFPDVTESDVRRAHSKYGRVVNPTRDEVVKTVNDLRTQQRLIESRTDAENNIRPKKTGLQREKPSQAQRDLDRQVRDLVKEKEEQKKFSSEDQANVRASALDAVHSRLENLEQDLLKEISDLKDGKEVRNRQRTPVERDQRARDLQTRVDALRKERDSLKGAPELTADQWNKRMIASTKRVTDELERRVREKDFDAKKKPSFEANAELEAARKARDEAREALHQHEDYKKNAEQQAVAQIKRNLANRIAENEERIKNEDFASRPKKKPYSDDEIELQKMKLLKQREKIQQGNLALQKANRTKVQKFFDGAVNLKKAMVLSSAAVYGKLSTAAVVKSGLTGLEDLQGGILKKILPKAVSKGAKIESGSSAKALGQAFSRAFSKGMKDAADTLKTGKTDLDLKYGKPKALDEGWTSLLGRMHGFIKAPVKRLAFEYAQAKQYENYLKEGVDVSSDPLLMEKVALKSYEYANRAIFMNDNGLSQTWNLALNHLLKKGGGWAGLGRAMRILLPIIKVPTNIALEAGLYAGGIPIGLFKLAKAWKAGIDNVSDEESEAIHRALKKGSLGSALMLMGFFNPQMFGGYYQKGIKRKDNEAEYGGMQINGENIPKWLLHSPAFEVLQMGATARRVADSRFHGQQRGLSSGALAGAIGLASEVPFVSEMLRTGDLESPEGRSKYFGELAKAQVIPAALDQLARHQDHTSSGKPIKREPRNFTEVLKSGVPGLREQVPAKKPPKTP